MRRFWLLVGSLIVLGCGSGNEDPGTGPGGGLNLSGSWSWGGSVSNSELQVTCNASGSLGLTQAGNTLTGQLAGGSGSCTGPGGSFSFDPNGPISGGSVNGSTVTYTDSVCTYTGTLSGDPVDTMQGTATCMFNFNGQDIPLTGTWHASR